jgi:hypothetical protein
MCLEKTSDMMHVKFLVYIQHMPVIIPNNTHLNHQFLGTFQAIRRHKWKGNYIIYPF